MQYKTNTDHLCVLICWYGSHCCSCVMHGELCFGNILLRTGFTCYSTYAITIKCTEHLWSAESWVKKVGGAVS